jgi:hypothetical protein
MVVLVGEIAVDEVEHAIGAWAADILVVVRTAGHVVAASTAVRQVVIARTAGQGIPGAYSTV